MHQSEELFNNECGGLLEPNADDTPIRYIRLHSLL